MNTPQYPQDVIAWASDSLRALDELELDLLELSALSAGEERESLLLRMGERVIGVADQAQHNTLDAIESVALHASELLASLLDSDGLLGDEALGPIVEATGDIRRSLEAIMQGVDDAASALDSDAEAIEDEPVEVESVEAEPATEDEPEVASVEVEPVAEEVPAVESIEGEPVEDERVVEDEPEVASVEDEPVGDAEPDADSVDAETVTDAEPVEAEPVAEDEQVEVKPVADEVPAVEYIEGEPVEAESVVEDEPVEVEAATDLPPEAEPSEDTVAEIATDPMQPQMIDPTAPQEIDPTAPQEFDPMQPQMIDPTAPQEIDPAKPQMIDPTAPQEIDPAAAAGPMMLSPEDIAALSAEDTMDDDAWGTTPLMLQPEQAEQLQYMVGDFTTQLEQVAPVLNDLTDYTVRGEAAQQVNSIASEMRNVAGFFEFRSQLELLDLLIECANAVENVPEPLLPELIIRVRGIVSLLEQHAVALQVGMETNWPLDTLRERTRALLRGEPLDPSIVGWHLHDPERLTELDRVVEGIDEPPSPGDPVPDGGWEAALSDKVKPPSEQQAAATNAAQSDDSNVPTLRVRLDRIERLLDLVRQLVLVKNRVAGISRTMRSESGGERIEELGATAESMGRLLAELQASVMETRTQRIEPLFERYARLLRDVARINDKEVVVELEGIETPIDKFTLEEVADPLSELLRHTVINGIETESQRSALGKSPSATARLAARSSGGLLVIDIHDDGGGFDREDVLSLATAAGIISSDKAEQLSDRDVFLLQADPALERHEIGNAIRHLRDIGARLEVESEQGVGTHLSLAIPLTSAVIPGMLVTIGDHSYGLPLESIREIVRIDPASLHHVDGRPAYRLRDEVIGVIESHAVLQEPIEEGGAGFFVVVSGGSETAAVVVDRIIGQREFVIESLDSTCGNGELFSGVTIGESGEVTLVLDVLSLFDAAQRTPIAAAA